MHTEGHHCVEAVVGGRYIVKHLLHLLVLAGVAAVGSDAFDVVGVLLVGHGGVASDSGETVQNIALYAFGEVVVLRFDKIFARKPGV